jgi:competence protein ComEC
VFVAVAAGIAIDRAWPLSPTVWLGSALASCGLWLPLWLSGWSRSAAVALLLAAAATGGGWHHLRWHTFPADDLAEFTTDEPQPIAVRAVALEQPRHLPAAPLDPLRAIPSGDRWRALVRLAAVRDGQEWRSASGQADLMVHGCLMDIRAGDTLEVLGQGSRMRPPANPGDIDFAAYYRADCVRTRLRANSPEAVTIIERGSPWTLTRALDAMRRHGDAMLTKYVGPDRAGFAAALLLNRREQLDAERTEAFLQTNTIHYLAISGMHVAILAGTLIIALRWGLLPRRWALLAVALAATGYVLLTGSPPSAVRSLVIVLLFCLASLVGRPTSAFNCLAAAGLFVVAINPADFFRVGAQLSFLAVGTLAWFGPKWAVWQQQDALQRLIARSRPWPLRLMRRLARWTWRTVAVTVAVWLVTLPLTMNQFHLVSPVAILLSPLLWLPIGLAMMSGFGVMLCGWLPPLGWVCGRICDANLAAIDWLVQRGCHLPASHFWVPGPDEWWLAVLYAGLALWAALPPRRGLRLGGLAALAVWTALGAADAWLQPRGDDRLECTFISVGHGCSVLLELPDGQKVLYDAGQLGSPASGARQIAGCLWWRGIRRLDAVVISHADVDHYNALPLLLKRFSVGRIYVSPLMFRADRDPRESLAVSTLREAIDDAGVPIEIIHAGHEIPAGAGCSLRLLHPPPEGVPPKSKRDDRDNANSIVLAVEYAGQRMLLPGDLEKRGVDRLLAQPAWDCDVLLAPHHGSAQSNPAGFAGWSTPEWVIISGGHDASPAVLTAYEDRGGRVLHTARDGAVRVRLRRDAVEVSHWRDGVFQRVDDHR